MPGPPPPPPPPPQLPKNNEATSSNPDIENSSDNGRNTLNQTDGRQKPPPLQESNKNDLFKEIANFDKDDLNHVTDTDEPQSPPANQNMSQIFSNILSRRQAIANTDSEDGNITTDNDDWDGVKYTRFSVVDDDISKTFVDQLSGKSSETTKKRKSRSRKRKVPKFDSSTSDPQLDLPPPLSSTNPPQLDLPPPPPELLTSPIIDPLQLDLPPPDSPQLDLPPPPKELLDQPIEPINVYTSQTEFTQPPRITGGEDTITDDIDSQPTNYLLRPMPMPPPPQPSLQPENTSESTPVATEPVVEQRLPPPQPPVVSPSPQLQNVISDQNKTINDIVEKLKSTQEDSSAVINKQVRYFLDSDKLPEIVDNAVKSNQRLIFDNFRNQIKRRRYDSDDSSDDDDDIPCNRRNKKEKEHSDNMASNRKRHRLYDMNDNNANKPNIHTLPSKTLYDEAFERYNFLKNSDHNTDHTNLASLMNTEPMLFHRSTADIVKRFDKRTYFNIDDIVNLGKLKDFSLFSVYTTQTDTNYSKVQLDKLMNKYFKFILQDYSTNTSIDTIQTNICSLLRLRLDVTPKTFGSGGSMLSKVTAKSSFKPPMAEITSDSDKRQTMINILADAIKNTDIRRYTWTNHYIETEISVPLKHTVSAQIIRLERDLREAYQSQNMEFETYVFPFRLTDDQRKYNNTTTTRH